MQRPIGHIPLQGNRFLQSVHSCKGPLLGTLSQTECTGQEATLAHPPSPWWACTLGWGMLGTEPVKPFSVMVLWELLGELGPEPGIITHVRTLRERQLSPGPARNSPPLPGPVNRDKR